MYLEAAKALLKAEYEWGLKQIKSPYQQVFMEEKIRHSYQVLGAANFLLKHEKCFSDCSLAQKDRLQAIVLLHDIGRFRECVEGFEGKRLDHGVYGAAFLEKQELFADADGVLAVKHHGHLIEELYQDDVYQKLLPEDKENVRKISFLVRDADKLANFYLLASQFEENETVFFVERVFSQPFGKIVSESIRADFCAHCSIKRGEVQNFAEMALFFLAWIFDLNYHFSFVFIKRLKIAEKLLIHFSKFWQEEDRSLFKHEIEKYVLEYC